jgi:hypothetical protein
MLKRTSARITVLATAVAAAGLGATLTATGAHGSPFGCSATKTSSYSAHAICTGGTGYVRVKFTCEDGIQGFRYDVYGPWVVVPNHYSSASCSSPQRQSIVVGPGYDLSG